MDGGDSRGRAARPRSGARRHRCRAFECEAAGNRFDGALATGASEGASSLAQQSPLLALSTRLLGDGYGFMPALEHAYDTSLQQHRRRLLLIQGIEASGAFLMEPRHRAGALDALCRQILNAPGMLLVYPPTTLWHAAREDAQFRLHHAADQNLMLCTLMGELGFAQLCDDELGHPIPLLTVPWEPDQGMLAPAALPRKSFSGMLRVERIARRRLVLFDVRCAPGAA